MPALTDADYFLAGATVTVVTGNDNKEATNSRASFVVRPRKSGGIVAFQLTDYKNEIKSNQTTPLRLDRSVDFDNPQNSLAHFRKNGLFASILYCNSSFCTDAWKINSISVTLEFRDRNGNPAPSGFGSKTINFPTADGILGFRVGNNPFWASNEASGINCSYWDQLGKLLLKTDEYFNALPAQFVRYNVDDAN